MKEKIFEILNGIRPEINFRAKDDFFDDGFRDSMEFIQFITQLNEQFDIQIDGEDIIPENFSNVDAILGLLQKYNVSSI